MEQGGELDCAMAELRESERTSIAWIERQECVIEEQTSSSCLEASVSLSQASIIQWKTRLKILIGK